MFASWGWGEWLIVLVIVVIIFGVGRLPEVGGALGKAIREFRSQTKVDEEEEATEGPEES
jgi:sec-independent protein translocase protein TatA